MLATDDFARARSRMVETQLRARGIADARVLDAMGRVPREHFVPESLQDRAYDDGALPIGHGQTISQPYMVARTCELAAIGPDARVLEVGAGSGYQAAVLGLLAAKVVAIELLDTLAEAARARLSALGYDNVDVVCADGTRGMPDAAPFDAIVVAAGGPRVPDALLEQLAEGGRLVIPLDTGPFQTLTVLRKRDGRVEQSEHDTCVFVPLRGDY